MDFPINFIWSFSPSVGHLVVTPLVVHCIIIGGTSMYAIGGCIAGVFADAKYFTLAFKKNRELIENIIEFSVCEIKLITEIRFNGIQEKRNVSDICAS